MSAILRRIFTADLFHLYASKSLLLIGLFAINGEIFASDSQAPTLFESQFKLNAQGQHDLSHLSQCQLPASGLKSDRETQKIYAFEQLVSPSTSTFNQRQLSFESSPSISREQMHLKGNVTIQDAKSIIRADDVILNKQTNQFSASGNVSLETADAYLDAESLLKSAQDETTLNNAQFYFFANNGNGQAEKIAISSDNKTSLENLTFSTCPMGDDTWQIATSELNIDQTAGRGEAWNTTLRVSGIPIFYFPYINFPTDDRRKTGLLTPGISKSDNSGVDFSLPFYWNISPELDATFTFHEIEKRDQQLVSELRWLTGISLATWEFEWMEQDQLVAQALQNATAGTELSADSAERWQSQFDYQATFNSNWRLKLNNHRASDSDYFRDFGIGLQASNTTQLASHSNLNYQDPIWDLNLSTLAYQSLIGRETYRYVPSFQANGSNDFENGVHWQIEAQWDQFEHKDISQLEATRTNLKPSISYPLTASWGFAIPKISYQSSQYKQTSQISGQSTRLERHLPIFSFDSGLHFDRSIGEDNLFSDGSLTHTFSPRFFYSYIPYKAQSEIQVFDSSLSNFDFNQLWQADRFNGIDRVGDTNHLSMAFANTFVKNSSGESLFHFNLGRSYYFDTRKVQLNGELLQQNSSSPWLAELDYQLSAATEISAFIEWDSSSKQTNQTRTQIKFEPMANHIVNVSHRYRQLNLTDSSVKISEESDFSFAWPMNDRWRLVGRWYNDLNRGQTIEAFFGVEYESCCWAIRVVGQKYLNTQLDSLGQPISFGSDEFNQGINLQFVFKGLGSVGKTGLTELLESSIKGYTDPFLN